MRCGRSRGNSRTSAHGSRAAERAAGRAARDRSRSSRSPRLSRPSAIRPVIAAGQRVFGENRVQEAEGEMAGARAPRCRASELHLIGPLQSNKAREAVALFDAIHTVDRDSIAAALAKEIARQGRRPRLLVAGQHRRGAAEGGRPARGGRRFRRPLPRRAWPRHRRPDVHPAGREAPAPHFALLAKIASARARSLSMGMSADFETAIAFGATHVRVGSATGGRMVDRGVRWAKARQRRAHAPSKTCVITHGHGAGAPLPTLLQPVVHPRVAVVIDLVPTIGFQPLEVDFQAAW